MKKDKEVVYTAFKADYIELGVEGILKKTEKQSQNPKFHSFDVGQHRQKVEEAIQKITEIDEDAKTLQGYGLLHDLAKGYTTVYKEDGTPSEIGHEKIMSKMMKELGGFEKEMIFVVENHHFFSNQIQKTPGMEVSGFGEMNEETNVAELTTALISNIYEKEIFLDSGYEKILQNTIKEFGTKEKVLNVMKLLGYALLADALGGFKALIAVPQFYKAQLLIRLEETLEKSNQFWFEEDKESFGKNVTKAITKMTIEKLKTPKDWVFDLNDCKGKAIVLSANAKFKMGNTAEKEAISLLKRLIVQNKI